MKKGVNAWIYPQNFKITDILRLSKNIGYEGVELNLDEEMLKMSRNERRAIVDETKSLGLELPSICTGLFWKYNLASPDQNVRRRGVEIIRQGCEFASDIGARVFLVVPAVATREVPYQDMWRLSKESILEAARSAEDCGVIIGVENVWNRFLYSPLEFRKFIEEINHPNVKIYFDIGNAAFLGFPEQWIRHLGDLIICVHVKDFQFSTMQFRPIFEGNIQWQSVMEALKEVGYNGFLIVELSPYSGHPSKAALDSKSALDILFDMI